MDLTKTIFFERLFSNGLGIHDPTNPGQVDIIKNLILIDKLAENRTNHFPSVDTDSRHADSFIGVELLQQARDNDDGKGQSDQKNMFRVDGFENAEVFAGVWYWWSY